MIISSYLLILFCCSLCLFRVARGPTAADRIMATNILGSLVVAFCILLSLQNQVDWPLSIGLAWLLLNFIGTIAFAKFLEGRGFDE